MIKYIRVFLRKYKMHNIYNSSESKREKFVDYHWKHALDAHQFQHTLLMTGLAEGAPFAGECHQVFMATVFTLHTGKAVVQKQLKLIF